MKGSVAENIRRRNEEKAEREEKWKGRRGGK